jgi:hypothetical protein
MKAKKESKSLARAATLSISLCNSYGPKIEPTYCTFIVSNIPGHFARTQIGLRCCCRSGGTLDHFGGSPSMGHT